MVTTQQGHSWREGLVGCLVGITGHQGLASAAIILCTCSSLYASLCFCENSSSSRVTMSCSLYFPAYVYSSYRAQFVLNSAVCCCNQIGKYVSLLDIVSVFADIIERSNRMIRRALENGKSIVQLMPSSIKNTNLKIKKLKIHNDRT